MSSSSSPPTSSACAPSTATFTLKLKQEEVPSSTGISMATLSTELSEYTMARFGNVSDEETDAAHSRCPPDFTGRCILVFWRVEPTLYDAHPVSSGIIFSPAFSGANSSATEPAILIDPRGLDLSRIDFTTGTISPDAAPEATEGSSKTSHNGKSALIQHSSAGGSGKGNGQGKKSGGDDGPSKGKQGSKPNDTRVYGDSMGTAIEYLSELPQMVISAHELLTFFPHHTKWPTVIFRLYRNGWSTGAMAKLQLHARNLLDSAQYERRQQALRHQMRTAAINKYGPGSKMQELKQQGHVDLQPFSPHSSGNDVDLYDVRNPIEPSGDTYSPPRGQNTLPEPARLIDVINGVINWPTGQDAGQLTQALRYAQANGLLQQTTRDLPGIVLQQGFVVQTQANTTQYDLRAVERLNNAVAAP